MIKLLKRATLCLICLTLLTGLIYPLIVTGLAQLFFREQANGSLIKHNNEIVGSALIAQNFNSVKYFHGRPSAVAYDAAASGASNLGGTNKKLLENIEKNIKEVRRENNLSDQQAIPSDLVTTSASGLDPEISVESAYLQVNRIAKARNLSVEKIRNLVKTQIIGRQFGILGESRVNVLKLNIALDKL